MQNLFLSWYRLVLVVWSCRIKQLIPTYTTVEQLSDKINSVTRASCWDYIYQNLNLFSSLRIRGPERNYFYRFYSSTWTFGSVRKEGKHLRPGCCTEENCGYKQCEISFVGTVGITVCCGKQVCQNVKLKTHVTMT